MFGRSFLTAGVMMSLIALPMVFAATREGLQSVPAHVREASYGLGKTKIATIRRVLIPSVRPNISTGMALGMGRIAGDTAIVIVLLGATLDHRGYSSTEVGGVLAGVLAGTIVASLAVARWGDRFGRPVGAQRIFGDVAVQGLRCARPLAT